MLWILNLLDEIKEQKFLTDLHITIEKRHFSIVCLILILFLAFFSQIKKKQDDNSIS